MTNEAPQCEHVHSLPNAEALSVLMEEYRQLYELSRLRLNALDRRAPIAAATFAAVLASLESVGSSMQGVLLIAVPLSLVWWLASTATHARSFEDALRRIEVIERMVNEEFGKELLVFQSSHPSRGEATGGRTGDQTIQAVLGASAVILGACLARGLESGPLEGAWRWIFGLFLAAISGVLLRMAWQIRRYRYRPRDKIAERQRA